MNRGALLAAGPLLPALPAAAQDAYPSRPIQMIVPFPPGGVADITGRPVAHVMGRLLKQSVVVGNKAGAGRRGGRGVKAVGVGGEKGGGGGRGRRGQSRARRT